jgi:hypothetical protein
MLLLTLTKTRYADFTPTQARLVTLVVAIAIAYGLTLTQDLTWTKKLANPASGDSANYARIAERVRNGENYYAAAHYELKNNNYRTSSVFDFRLPTLALLTANMPKPVMAQFLLGALGIVNLFLWLRYWLELEKSLLNACLGGILLMGSTLPCFLSVSSYFHEIWAGTLLSISIVLRMSPMPRKLMWTGRRVGLIPLATGTLVSRTSWGQTAIRRFGSQPDPQGRFSFRTTRS